MNKEHYRLVFNKLRGVLMAVAEHVASQGKSARQNRSKVTHPRPAAFEQHLRLKPLMFAVMRSMVSVIGFSPLNNSALADIVADPGAAASLRPIIINAANGVPLVNIQTPSLAGVSRNAYSQFDVNNHGAILNNSRNNVQTQLGGFVQGNPYLATGAARVILNEVNSQNPSLLNGYIEVAGSRAQVVIANPAGISCNGCGFINAHRTTLTTGTPQLNNGDLIGYRVTTGAVNILGAGLDSSNSNYTDLIARAVTVNAGLWAKNLNVTTGENQVVVDSADNTNSTATIAPAGNRPAFAIDVAALGGMYAQKIHLIGTEAGLGVRNAGQIGASAGEVSIDVNGMLSNAAATAIIASSTQTHINAADIINTAGTISAGELLNINAASLSGDGKLFSAGDATISLNSDYNHGSNGQLQAARSLSLTTLGDINNQAKILAGNTLSLNAANVDNQASAELSGLDTLLNISGTLINRGLIDGRDTYINAGSVNNIGTGSIFGDHIAIAATTLNNDVETVLSNSIATTTAAVIAARNRLDLGVSNAVTNREHATLFSADYIGIAGALDASHQASVLAGLAQTNTLNNNSATIEALGNVSLNVANINNTNEHFTTQVVQVLSAPMQEYQLAPGDVYQPFDISSRYLPHEVTLYDCEALCITAIQSGNNSDAFIRYDFNRTVTETQIANTDPGLIIAGGDMQILADNLLNDKSKVIAGSTLTANINTLSNTDVAGEHTITESGYSSYFYRIREKGRDTYGISVAAYNPADSIQAISLAPSHYLANTNPASIGLASGRTIASLDVNTLPNNSLFHSNPNPAANYLIETDPRFANYRTWLSSDYMLTALAYDPTLITARLGDGFYEQKLVREQVAQLTGRRFLTSYANDEDQYKALMTAGASVAQQFKLRPGIALSAEQMAQLTTDIVWLVQQTVKLADGSSQQALVPQVYVRVKDGDIAGNGALISAENTSINLVADINNSNGSIAGRDLLSINADNLNNLGGRLSANNVSVSAQHDLNNIGGKIEANTSLMATAGNDINVISTSSTQTKLNAERTNIKRVAGLYVTGDRGLLVASAGNDIHLEAAQIINQTQADKAKAASLTSTTLLSAGRDFNLGTVTESENNRIVWDSKNYLQQGSSQDHGTSIQSSGNIQLQAGHDVNAIAANISSGDGSNANLGGSVKLSAGNSINLSAGQATQNLDEAHQTKSKGFLSSRTFTTQDNVNQTNSIGSSLSADSITLQSGKDINGQGSNIVATQATTLNAANNINITTAQNTNDETHLRDVKKSGLMSSGGVGFTIGKQQLTNTNDTQSVSNTASTLGSINGDVNINSGKDTTITGSDLIAGRDINVTGRNVSLDAAYDTNASNTETKFKQSGLSIGLTAPVITAAQAALASADRSSAVKSDKLKALYAVKAVQNVAKAALALQSIANSTNPANASGIQLSISLGRSQSQSSSNSHETTAKVDSLTAGRDININALDDNANPNPANPNGNINMIGVTGTAGRDINLDAANDIKLRSATNSRDQQSTNKSSGANIGVAIGVTPDGKAGLSVFANANSAKGNSDGNAVSHTETTLKAKDTLTISSGHDTTLKGAIVLANTVIADIGTGANGGNLKLESEQDSANYKSKQNSANGGVGYTFGVGGFGGSLSDSKQKVDSTFNSVIEQTGIQAGDGGFNINVAGNTHLKAAVIDSSQTAQTAGNNQLTTQTLTTDNIENKGQYTASASNIGINVNGNANTGVNEPAGGTAGSRLKGGLSGVGVSDSGEASGTTKSAISTANITITDEVKQKALTGKEATQTVAMLNRDTQHANGSISNPYDQQKVAEKLEFLQVASEVVIEPLAAKAAKWIGDTFKPDPAHPDQIDPAKVAAHAALGAAISQLLGTGWQTGAAAGALGDVLPQVLAKAFEKNPVTGKPINEEAFKAVNVIISAALTSATGGDLAQTINAGMVTQNAVANNYLSHPENRDRETLRKNKADGNCDNACEQGLAILDTLDKQRDADFHAACDGALSSTSVCADATRDLYAKLGTFATPEARKAAADNAMSGFNTAHKDELQSYLDLIKTANPEVRTSTEGKVRDPSKYNSDSYGIIDKDDVWNTYLVMKFGTEALTIANTYEDGQYWFTDNAARNGMLNPPDYVSGLMLTHMDATAETRHNEDDRQKGTNTPYQPIDRFTLSYAPTGGFLKDLGGTAVSKTGIDSEPILALRNQLESIQSGGNLVYWMAHSRGAEDFVQAAAGSSLQDLSNNLIVFHAGANTRFMTEPILGAKHIKLYNEGYLDAPNDLVPQIIGLRFLSNPLNLVRSLVALPCVFLCSPDASPHTLPYSWNNLQKELP